MFTLSFSTGTMKHILSWSIVKFFNNFWDFLHKNYEGEDNGPNNLNSYNTSSKKYKHMSYFPLKIFHSIILQRFFSWTLFLFCFKAILFQFLKLWTSQDRVKIRGTATDNLPGDFERMAGGAGYGRDGKMTTIIKSYEGQGIVKSNDCHRP